jgi:hypothetical protein
MRFGLCRHFSQELDIDIVKDPAFKKANDVLTAVTVQLKREGLGKVDYTPSLEPDELKYIYNSTGMRSPGFYHLLMHTVANIGEPLLWHFLCFWHLCPPKY